MTVPVVKSQTSLGVFLFVFKKVSGFKKKLEEKNGAFFKSL